MAELAPLARACRGLSAIAAGLLAATLAAAPTASPAFAAPVTYAFSGVVDHDEADRGWAHFAGQFSFDRDAVDAIADPSTGAYAHAGAPWGLTVTFDGVETVTLDSLFHVLVGNDLNWGFGPEDHLGLLAEDAAGRVVSVDLWDFTGLLFASDALPLPEGGLTLASFSWTSFRYESSTGVLQGRLDGLTCLSGCSTDVVTPPPIPEPGTWALTLAGLAAMVTLQRRRRTPR
ncbi:MAG: PEP-CTERM sorting domain-containing protein [Rubrivivax sp.]|nr:PEP-CTERM sorting domain-containing protein [Rubrivivax sp.]